MASLGAPLLIPRTFLRSFPDPLNERFLLRETAIPVRQLRRVLTHLAQSRLLHSIRKEGQTLSIPAPEDLLGLAEANLYRAKANGRNLVIWGL